MYFFHFYLAIFFDPFYSSQVPEVENGDTAKGITQRRHHHTAEAVQTCQHKNSHHRFRIERKNGSRQKTCQEKAPEAVLLKEVYHEEMAKVLGVPGVPKVVRNSKSKR